ncbi:MAG: hypothetical protein IPK68_02050 [Bdellovibrionales bacterium]|nr:hypothetical protein [Bdellovibrionales bacterium]
MENSETGLLNAGKAPLKINFVVSSVLRDRITRGLDLDTSQRIQFKKFFAEGKGSPKDFNFYDEAANGEFRGISDRRYLVERESAHRAEYESRNYLGLGNVPLFQIFYVAFHLPEDQKKPILGFFRVYPWSLDLHLILDDENQSDGREIVSEFAWLATFSISQEGKTTSPGMERAMADLFPNSFYVLGFSFPLYRTDRHELITVERAAADIMTAVLRRNRGVLVDPKALEDLRKGSLNEYEAYVHERLGISGPDKETNPSNEEVGNPQQSCRLQLTRGD